MCGVCPFPLLTWRQHLCFSACDCRGRRYWFFLCRTLGSCFYQALTPKPSSSRFGRTPFLFFCLVICQGIVILDEGAISSDEDFSGGEHEAQESQSRREERDLKDRLMRKFGSHIGNLKLEFSKKKKKGKLPKEARQALLEWWNIHYKWPYPTEADKISLAESTGLDQKQINNWFINQRKRHWKPSEDMNFTLMDNIPGQFYAGD